MRHLKRSTKGSRMKRTKLNTILGTISFTVIAVAITQATQARPRLIVSSEVGTIVTSILSEEDFIRFRGNGWMLLAGQCAEPKEKTEEKPKVEGNPIYKNSKLYEITGRPCLPDARGRFLRGKANKKPGKEEVELGEVQSESTRSLLFSTSSYEGKQKKEVEIRVWKTKNEKSSGGLKPDPPFSKASGTGDGSDQENGITFRWKPKSIDDFHNEVRPENVTINYFIKVN